MKAYSTDLRQRVVAAYDAREGTQEQVAARFAVSVSWVRKLLRQRRDTGSIEPRPHGGGHAPAFDAAADAQAPPGRPRRLRRHAGGAGPRRRRGVQRLGGLPGAGPAGHHSQKKSRRAAEQDRPELKAERAAWRRGVRRGRPGPAGLRRRERGEHGDGPHPRPRPQRGAGRRAGAARPLEGHDADGRGAARRRAALGLPGLRRGDRLGLLRGLRRAVPGAGAAARRHRGDGQPGLPQDRRGRPG